MKKTLSIFTILAFGSPAMAQDSEKTLSDEPTFREIFKKSVADASSIASLGRRDSLTVELSGTMVTPTNVTLTNKYFEVPYAQSVSTLPGFQVGFSSSLVSSSRAQLSWVLQTGYAYTQVIGSAKSNRTGYTSTDSLRLQRVPLMVGVRGTYDSGPVAVFVEPVIGTQWLSQNGNLDGVSQNFWVPTGMLNAGLVLFSQTASNSWFGGIKVAAGYERGLGSDQKFEARHYEVGVRARL